MPVFRSEKLPGGVALVIWHITEEIAELYPHVHLWPEGQEEWMAIHHPQKQAEWLAGRLAVEQLCQDLGLAYSGTRKDEYGKPYLAEHSGQLSISHCWPYAAAAYHPQQSLGIDLEQAQDKLRRLAPKFLDEQERAWSGEDLEQLALRWSAKEALYKLHGRRRLAFREQLKTGAFEAKGPGSFAAEIIEEEATLPCQVYFERATPTHWLTVALPTE